MIFQKLAKKCTESSLHIDNEIIEIVQNYTYLGTLMALGKLKEKALHALFCLRKRTNIRERSLFRAGEGPKKEGLLEINEHLIHSKEYGFIVLVSH